INVINVPPLWEFLRNINPASGEEIVILARVGPARLGPLLEMTQLHPQNRALHPLHAVVESLEHVVIALLLSPVAKHADRLRVLFIAGDDRAAFAVCAKILARVEAEAARYPETAGAAPLVLRAMSLAGILDDLKSMALGDVENRIHVGHLPVQ